MSHRCLSTVHSTLPRLCCWLRGPHPQGKQNEGQLATNLAAEACRKHQGYSSQKGKGNTRKALKEKVLKGKALLFTAVSLGLEQPGTQHILKKCFLNEWLNTLPSKMRMKQVWESGLERPMSLLVSTICSLLTDCTPHPGQPTLTQQTFQ